MTDGWIVVPNWDKFQHYTDRNPPWVKLHTDLTANDDWLGLGLAEKGLLTLIWVEFSRSHGHLSVRSVRRLCGKSARSVHFEALSDAGFIAIVASRPLALARTREEKVPSEPQKTRKPKNARTTGWREVRGSHGITTIPDPFGTDPAPVEWRTP